MNFSKIDHAIDRAIALEHGASSLSSHHYWASLSRDPAFLSSPIPVGQSPGLLRLRVGSFEGDLSHVLINMEEQSVSKPELLAAHNVVL